MAKGEMPTPLSPELHPRDAVWYRVLTLVGACPTVHKTPRVWQPLPATVWLPQSGCAHVRVPAVQ